MSAPVSFRVFRCVSCHSHFLPRPGRCPKCGSGSVETEEVAPVGQVLAATELTVSSSGWPTPHRIALVELAGGLRLLAVAPRHRPVRGDVVEVRAVGDHFELLQEPVPDGDRDGTRGGGASADRVGPGPAFEPPR